MYKRWFILDKGYTNKWYNFIYHSLCINKTLSVCICVCILNMNLNCWIVSCKIARGSWNIITSHWSAHKTRATADLAHRSKKLGNTKLYWLPNGLQHVGVNGKRRLWNGYCNWYALLSLFFGWRNVTRRTGLVPAAVPLD